MLLADSGRLREALAVLEPLLESPSDESAVYGQALMAHAFVLASLDRLDEAITLADKAVKIAADPTTRAMALLIRGLVHTFRGEHEAGVHDSEQGTALARELGPGAFAGALMLEAQARLFAGQPERAAKQLADAEHVGGPVDAFMLGRRYTIYADLAMLTGRTHDALEQYARSLEAAQASGNELQVMFDLRGVANALAVLGEDRDAFEVVGMVAAQVAELGGPGASVVEHLLGGEAVLAARQRVGPKAAAGHEARGRAVPAGARVDRACQLARAQQPAPMGSLSR